MAEVRAVGEEVGWGGRGGMTGQLAEPGDKENAEVKREVCVCGGGG